MSAIVIKPYNVRGGEGVKGLRTCVRTIWMAPSVGTLLRIIGPIGNNNR